METYVQIDGGKHMKGKRLVAWVLTAAMAVSLLTVSAAAVTFSDMTNHWAREDVEYLTSQGVVQGTSDTTFAPERAMTACEAVIFCSRTTGVSATDKAKIFQKWALTLQAIMPASLYSWAGEEMAVCLETGIISETELRSLSQSGGLVKAISRETLAMYLVRAMQLEPMAKSLTNYSLSFADASSVSPALQPYVYMLSSYGIVQGDQYNRFLPDRSLTRAEMAVMLRRAMDFMSERGLYAELPAFTDYEWIGGVITSVGVAGDGGTLLTLENPLSGNISVSLPTSIMIYENNMLTNSSALRTGQYARVNQNARGTAQAVRLSGALTTVTGTVSSVDQDRISLTVEGASRSYAIDRFTKVQAGSAVGGPEVIDAQAGYTTAQCYVDAMGHLAALKLDGGSRSEQGILVSIVETAEGQNLQVAAFNGETQRYTLPVGGTATIDGSTGVLSNAYVGDYVTMRIKNDSGNQLDSVAVDTVTQYIQGVVKSYSSSNITISNTTTNVAQTYNLASGVLVQYNGEAISLQKLERNCFATARLYGGQVAEISAWPGSTTTRGTLESITYGTPTILAVRTADNSVVTFEVDLTNLPTILRDGEASSIDKIRSGDVVTVTVRYNRVAVLETYSQTANVTGTITRVVQDTNGITIDVALASGGTVTYTVPDGVSVTQDGNAISLYTLKFNDKVAMVVNGDQVNSIEVQGGGSSTQLNATVLLPNASDGTLMVQLENGTVLTVDVSKASVVSTAGGGMTLNSLKVGDSVQIYGNYSGSKFIATLVLKL